MASKDIKYHGKIYKISYDIKNNDLDECILILHGWGASKEIMIKAFENHFTNLKQIYVDLPGFGKSTIHGPLKTKDYKNIINNFIESIKINPKTIMGHSFGGKVATLLNPSNLVLLSTAGIVEKKPFGVRLKIAIFKFFKILGLGSLYRLFASKDVAGMNRVMYETLKNVVNENFEDIFAKFNGNALIFWGKTDRAVALKSGELIHRLIKKSEFYPLDGDHFFFLLHSKMIAEEIEKKIKEGIKNTYSSDVFDELDEISEAGEVFTRSSKKTKEPNLDESNLKISKEDTEAFKEQKEEKIKDKIEKDIEEDLKSEDIESVQVEEVKFVSEEDSLEENIKFAIETAEEEELKEKFSKNPMEKYKNLDEVSSVGEVYTRKPKKKVDENSKNKQEDIEQNIKEETQKIDISKENENLKDESKKDEFKKDNEEEIIEIQKTDELKVQADDLPKEENADKSNEKKVDENRVYDSLKKDELDLFSENNLDTNEKVEENEEPKKEGVEIVEKNKFDTQNSNTTDTKEIEKKDEKTAVKPNVKSFTEIYKARLEKLAKQSNENKNTKKRKGKK